MYEQQQYKLYLLSSYKYKMTQAPPISKKKLQKEY